MKSKCCQVGIELIPFCNVPYYVCDKFDKTCDVVEEK